MINRPNREEPLIDETAWMLTLSDLLMLLLTLFALRLSMGQLRPDSLPSAAKVDSGEGSGEGLSQLRVDALTNTARQGELAATLDDQAAAGSTLFLKHESGGGFNFAGVQAAQRGLNTEIALRSVFSSQTAELTFQGAENLQRVAKAIAGEQLEIGIAIKFSEDTYRDIPADEIASLTTARMAAVLRQMIDGGVEPQSLYGNFAESAKPSVTSSEDVASESVELLIRRSFTPPQFGR